jgi:hypothetical protein
VSGPRSLLRFAPLLIGALAAAAWMRRRRAEQARVPAPPPRPAIEPRAEPPAPVERRRSEDEAVDIVTVVDDLLLADR